MGKGEKQQLGPILIQGAMPEETNLLVSCLENPEEREIGGYRFWCGSYRGKELVVSRTEIGEINAACVTTLGILTFAPTAILNQGIAGAHSIDLHIGDIVVGETAVHINNWATELKTEGEGSDPFTWSQSFGNLLLRADPTLVKQVAAADYQGGKLLLGRLGSGDLFSREADRILWLQEKCGHICEDMESIAVYGVCHRMGVPCLGVRIVSNNELTGEAYKPEVGEGLQAFLLGVLSGIGN